MPIKIDCLNYGKINVYTETEMQEAYLNGYELGHNDTVESCYGDSEGKAIDYTEAIRQRGE